MSGMMMALLGSAGGRVNGPLNVSATNAAAGAGSSTATVSFQPDGSTTATGGGNQPWYIPLTAAIGASYWISTAGGAWVSLSAAQSWSLTGTNATASYAIRVASDSAGVNIEGTGTISLSVSNGL